MRPATEQRSSWRLLSLGLVLALLAGSGCSGVTPEEYRNNREEGPEQGLFSGPDGEFVILAPAKKSPVPVPKTATP